MESNKVKRSIFSSQLEPQFQIRKVPLKRFIPEKTPELYALDVHSICLPSRNNKKIINWASVNCDFAQHHYEEDFNDQIIFSHAYKQLYSKYLTIKEKHHHEKVELEQVLPS